MKRTLTVLAILLLSSCATYRHDEVIEAYQRGLNDAFELAKYAPRTCSPADSVL